MNLPNVMGDITRKGSNIKQIKNGINSKLKNISNIIYKSATNDLESFTKKINGFIEILKGIQKNIEDIKNSKNSFIKKYGKDSLKGLKINIIGENGSKKEKNLNTELIDKAKSLRNDVKTMNNQTVEEIKLIEQAIKNLTNNNGAQNNQKVNQKVNQKNMVTTSNQTMVAPNIKRTNQTNVIPSTTLNNSSITKVPNSFNAPNNAPKPNNKILMELPGGLKVNFPNKVITADFIFEMLYNSQNRKNLLGVNNLNDALKYYNDDLPKNIRIAIKILNFENKSKDLSQRTNIKQNMPPKGTYSKFISTNNMISNFNEIKKWCNDNYYLVVNVLKNGELYKNVQEYLKTKNMNGIISKFRITTNEQKGKLRNAIANLKNNSPWKNMGNTK